MSFYFSNFGEDLRTMPRGYGAPIFNNPRVMGFGAPAGAIGSEADFEQWSPPKDNVVPTGSASEWASWSQPPNTQAVVVPEGSSKGFFDIASQLVGGFVNIFGQRVNPPQYTAPPPSSTPSWLVPVAVVGGAVVLGSVFMAGKSRRMAGYRRRSRRSRR